jgi:hypothetical protein
MLPEERGWHCRLCSKHVHDLSSMTETQVRELLDSGEDICVAYDVDGGGAIMFQPERIVPIARLVRRPIAAALAPAAAGLALALAACTPHGDEHEPRLDASDLPTQVQSSPVIPERAPDPEPLHRVEVQDPEVEPCDSTKPSTDPVPPIRHMRGEVAPVRDLKGRRRKPA